MNIKAEVDVVINALEAIINLVEKVDPAAANDPVVIKLQEMINLLKGLGL